VTTQLEICNRALAAIAAKTTIAGINELSNEAAKCRLLYVPTRRQMLRGAHWNFARIQNNLTLLKAAPGTPENPTIPANTNWNPATQPPPPWVYEYAYPPDCILLRYIPLIANVGNSQGNPIPITAVQPYTPPTISDRGTARFTVTNDPNVQGSPQRVILANQPNSMAIYTTDVVIENLWDDAFQEAMVAALASRLAMPLTGDKAMYRQQAQAALAMLEEARRTDGNEGFTIEEWVPDWIAVRGFSGDYTTPSDGFFFGLWQTPSFLIL